MKKKKNSNTITSVDECVIDYIKAKQRTSEENTKKLFLLSLLPDLNEMNYTQFRKFRTQVNVLIDDILKPTQDTSLCSTPQVHGLVDPHQDLIMYRGIKLHHQKQY